MKKNVVISGINLVDGGPLSVFKDYLDSLMLGNYNEKYNIIVLVANKELFVEYSHCFTLYEFPKAKKSWFVRLYYEYFYFKKLSNKIDVYLWLSMHDVSPNVKADIKAVYCHNPTVVFDMKLNEIKYDKKVFLFSKFYKYLYKINIKQNDYVIVQQNWLKEYFIKKYNINTVISSRPNVKVFEQVLKESASIDGKYRFIFAAFPRFFKNFEVICKACKLLDKEKLEYEVILTVDGTENRYSKELVEDFSDTKNIKFVGVQTREEVYRLYAGANAMIFPSRLETWGLPITEFQSLMKPMIVADLPYAHETVGDYEFVSFFNVTDEKQLAGIMNEYIKSDNVKYDGNEVKTSYDCYTWNELNQKIFTK